MVQHLIVPFDGSPEAWRAFDVALSLAEHSGSTVRVVQVASDPVDGQQAKEELDDELLRRGPFVIDVEAEVKLTVGPIADALAEVMMLHPGATVVMASHGRGRSAAFLGSVTEDLVHKTFGPIILVGPNVEPDDFSGPIIVSVDGSPESEAAVPLAVAWAIEFRATPWIVNVTTPNTQPATADGFDSAYVAGLAKRLSSSSGHPVEFEELHDQHPSRAVPEYAARHEASMIVASSHGRSGLSRLAMGSVTADFVRNATCPVAVVRLPHPAHAEQNERMWAY